MATDRGVATTAMPANGQLALDTAGMLFALAFSDKQKSLARFTVTMHDRVDVDHLQTALDSLRQRFPSFYVRLCHDRTRFYFETLAEAPRIVAEAAAGEPLFMTLDDFRRCVFRVVVAENCISLEYFHAMTDGYGAGVFLKSLLAEYLHQRYGLAIPPSAGIHLANDVVSEDEIKDAYLEIPGVSGRLTDLTGAFTLKGEKETKTRITVLSFKTADLLACAASYQVTLTALLAGAITAALFDWQRQTNSKKEIRIAIPVDLRKRFHSHTLRNFMTSITIGAGQLNAEMPFSALCKSYDEQLKLKVNNDDLAALASSYVKAANNRIVAALPLSLKRWAVRTFFSVYRGGNCLTFSNLGVWSLPQVMTPYITMCSVAFSPKPSAPYTCCLVSVGNHLTLTLTRNFKESILESRIPQFINKVLTTNIANLRLS